MRMAWYMEKILTYVWLVWFIAVAAQGAQVTEQSSILQRKTWWDLLITLPGEGCFVNGHRFTIKLRYRPYLVAPSEHNQTNGEEPTETASYGDIKCLFTLICPNLVKTDETTAALRPRSAVEQCFENRSLAVRVQLNTSGSLGVCNVTIGLAAHSLIRNHSVDVDVCTFDNGGSITNTSSAASTASTASPSTATSGHLSVAPTSEQSTTMPGATRNGSGIDTIMTTDAKEATTSGCTYVLAALGSTVAVLLVMLGALAYVSIQYTDAYKKAFRRLWHISIGSRSGSLDLQQFHENRPNPTVTARDCYDEIDPLSNSRFEPELALTSARLASTSSQGDGRYTRTSQRIRTDTMFHNMCAEGTSPANSPMQGNTKDGALPLACNAASENEPEDVYLSPLDALQLCNQYSSLDALVVTTLSSLAVQPSMDQSEENEMTSSTPRESSIPAHENGATAMFSSDYPSEYASPADALNSKVKADVIEGVSLHSTAAEDGEDRIASSGPKEVYTEVRKFRVKA